MAHHLGAHDLAIAAAIHCPSIGCHHNTSVACFNPTHRPEGNGDWCDSPIVRFGFKITFANHLLIAGIDGRWP